MAFDWNSLNPFYRKQSQGKGAAYSFEDSGIGKLANKLWNDYTGQSAVDAQNAAQMELAKYQTSAQEEFYNKYSSPEALMRQYKDAGLNPNLVYGSASAGQGNVPSFSAPQIQRNISGADKVNKALSLLSGISGAISGVYQAAAAREAAQQAAVKTANDIVNYRSNYRDNIFKQDVLGLKVSLPKFGIWKGGQNLITSYNKAPLYSQYLGAYRESEFNKFAEPVFRNYFDYGGMYDLYGNFLSADYLKTGLSPYMFTRNRQSQLKYSLMNELGNMGTYGKLAVSLLGTLF